MKKISILAVWAIFIFNNLLIAQNQELNIFVGGKIFNPAKYVIRNNSPYDPLNFDVSSVVVGWKIGVSTKFEILEIGGSYGYGGIKGDRYIVGSFGTYYSNFHNTFSMGEFFFSIMWKNIGLTAEYTIMHSFLFSWPVSYPSGHYFYRSVYAMESLWRFGPKVKIPLGKKVSLVGSGSVPLKDPEKYSISLNLQYRICIF